MEHVENDGFQLRPHSFRDLLGRGIPGVDIPSSTYTNSDGTMIFLFWNRSPKSNQIQILYQLFLLFQLFHSIDKTDGILFQLNIFPKNITLHSTYYSCIPPRHIPKGCQKECCLTICKSTSLWPVMVRLLASYIVSKELLQDFFTFNIIPKFRARAEELGHFRYWESLRTFPPFDIFRK